MRFLAFALIISRTRDISKFIEPSKGKMEDPNKEQREILARAIKEEQLR